MYYYNIIIFFFILHKNLTEILTIKLKTLKRMNIAIMKKKN